jgi:hypothetical protein
MATGAVKVVADGGGGYALVAAVDGLEVTFATVNASQVAEAQAAESKAVPVRPDAADEGSEG